MQLPSIHHIIILSCFGGGMPQQQFPHSCNVEKIITESIQLERKNFMLMVMGKCKVESLIESNVTKFTDLIYTYHHFVLCFINQLGKGIWYNTYCKCWKYTCLRYIRLSCGWMVNFHPLSIRVSGSVPTLLSPGWAAVGSPSLHPGEWQCAHPLSMRMSGIVLTLSPPGNSLGFVQWRNVYLSSHCPSDFLVLFWWVPKWL